MRTDSHVAAERAAGRGGYRLARVHARALARRWAILLRDVMPAAESGEAEDQPFLRDPRNGSAQFVRERRTVGALRRAGPT